MAKKLPKHDLQTASITVVIEYVVFIVGPSIRLKIAVDIALK